MPRRSRTKRKAVYAGSAPASPAAPAAASPELVRHGIGLRDAILVDVAPAVVPSAPQASEEAGGVPASPAAPASASPELVCHISCSARNTVLVGMAPALVSSAPTFEAFAASAALAGVFRAALAFVELKLGLVSHHFRVVPWRGGADGVPAGYPDKGLEAFIRAPEAKPLRVAAAASGFLLFVAGSSWARNVPVMGHVDDLDAPIIYQDADGKKVEVPDLAVRHVVIAGLEGGSLVRSCLDFQGRSCYVVVVSPDAPTAVAFRKRGEVVRRQSELADDELAALWRAAVECTERHGGFVEMQVNAGAFQNLAHLHLKVWVEEEAFVAVWGNEAVFQTLQGWRRHLRAQSAASRIAPGKTAKNPTPAGA